MRRVLSPVWMGCQRGASPPPPLLAAPLLFAARRGVGGEALAHTLYNFPMSSVTILHNSRAGHASYAGQVERLADDLSHDGLAVRLERRENIDGLRAAARAAAAAGANAGFGAGGAGTGGPIAAH